MNSLKRLAWAGVLAVAAGGASAQTTAVIPTTTGTLSGLGQTTSPTGNGITSQGAQGELTTDVRSTVAGFSQNAAAVDANSNIIGRYYANPLYQGRVGANTSALTSYTPLTPGGFGTVLYSGTGTAAAGTGGRATTTGRAGSTGTGLNASRTSTSLGGLGTGTLGGSTGLNRTSTGLGGASTGLGTAGGLGGLGTTGGVGGRTGGFGTTGGLGGVGGLGTQNQGLSTGRSVAYTQQLKFAAPPVPTPQLQAEVQTMLSTSSSLAGIQGLETLAGEGGVVVVRGTVANDDDARLVENMIRLTPGVKQVKNELLVAKP